MDLLQREGHYPVPPGASKILGVEFAGVIESLGSPTATTTTGTTTEDTDKQANANKKSDSNSNSNGSSLFQPGDEVFGLAYGGAYAEYIAVSTKMLIHKPAALDWTTAAGIPETWITATQALFLVGGWQAGQSVLWHAGASSVSIAGIQLCRGESASSKIYVTASSKEKIEFCRDLGADEGFNYTENEGKWDEEVLAATEGKGVDLIVDFVGGSYFGRNLNAIAKDGRIVNLGMLGGTKVPAGTDMGAFVRKRVRFEGSSLRSRDLEYQAQLRDMLVEHAIPKIVGGQFKVPIEKVFDWKDIQEAHRLMETNQTKGKIICVVD